MGNKRTWNKNIKNDNCSSLKLLNKFPIIITVKLYLSLNWLKLLLFSWVSSSSLLQPVIQNLVFCQLTQFKWLINSEEPRRNKHKMLFIYSQDIFHRNMLSLNWNFMWTRRPQRRGKSFLHVLLEEHLSPVQVLMCPVELALYLSTILDVSQEYTFSAVWRVMWFLKEHLWVKPFPHISQEYGLSPVWILMWTSKVLRRAKLFPHVLHEKGLSPVWVLMWPSRVLFRLNLFPHILQQ